MQKWAALFLYCSLLVLSLHKYCRAMDERIIDTKIRVYSYNELGEDEKKLVEMAKEATSRAYVPYSKFHVGAALLLENGEIITGANQENASFPAGTCAERSAIFYAAARYPGVRFVRLAITAWQRGDFIEEPAAPCGVCRQAILEYEKLGGQPIDILLCGRDVVYRIDGIRTLLPLSFEEF